VAFEDTVNFCIRVHNNDGRIAHQFVNGDSDKQLREARGDDDSCHLPESQSILIKSSKNE